MPVTRLTQHSTKKILVVFPKTEANR